MSQVAEAFVRIRPEATGFGAELNRQVQPQLGRFERQMKSSNRELERFGRGALVGSGALRGLGRAAAFASTSFIGGAGLVYGIKSTISAAMDAQAVLAQTRNAVERSGLSWATYGDRIEAATLAQANLSGFDDQRLQKTFSNLLRKTGDVNKALQLNALAADVARGRNIELEAAQSLVIRASLGMSGALRRVGIAAKTNATPLELIQLLTDKYAGSAEKFGETAAGAQARFHVALENTQELIGAAVLPSITKLLNKGTDWLNNTKNQERIQRDVNTALKDGGAVARGMATAFGDVKAVVNPLVDDLGGLKKVSELLFLLWSAQKVQAFAASLALVGPAAASASVGVAALGAASATTAAEMAVLAGSIGTTSFAGRAGLAAEAATATSKVGLLTRALGRVPAVVPITILAEVVINKKPIDSFFSRHGLGFLNNGLVPDIAGLFGGGDSPNASVNPAVNPNAKGPIRTWGMPAVLGATAPEGASPPPGYRASPTTRDDATATALAKAQAEGTKAQIVAAANARLKFINDTIAFANNLIAQGRGNTKALQATLQKFYTDEASTQGIIDQINDAAAQAAINAAKKAKQRAEAAKRKAKEAADRLAKAQADSEAAVLAFNEGWKTRINDLYEANQEDAQRRIAIHELTLQNNVERTRLIPNTEKELVAEKKAQMVLVNWYKRRWKQLGDSTLEGKQAESQYLSALDAYRNLGKKKQSEGFSLAQLFQEATSELALYGSNIGAPGTPLSAQEARGTYAGTVKAHQTVVVQNFNYPRSASQALSDAHAGARNLKS